MEWPSSAIASEREDEGERLISASSILRFVPASLEGLRMEMGDEAASIFEQWAEGVAVSAEVRGAVATDGMARSTREREDRRFEKESRGAVK